MTKMLCKRNKNLRSGAALLITLFITMAIALISLGFLVQSDMQLQSGYNYAIRAKTDYIARSGLTHAKTLLMNPQDADTAALGYWQGDAALQIKPGDDYYDVAITRSVTGSTPRCTYDVYCQAYKQEDAGAEKTARSNLAAQIRLDPCVTLWTATSTTLPASVTINGDIHCAGDLTSSGTLNGDVFANTLTGNAAGQLYALADAKVASPALDISNFTPDYYVGVNGYTSQSISDCNNVTYGSGPANPAGIFACGGDLVLSGNVTINGTLIVNGDLTITDSSNTVTAYKNYPAIVVSGQLVIDHGGQLNVNGLVQAGSVGVTSTAADITILGGLYTTAGAVNVAGTYASNFNVTAGPVMASLKTYTASEVYTKWTPAGGAFFKYIKRQ